MPMEGRNEETHTRTWDGGTNTEARATGRVPGRTRRNKALVRVVSRIRRPGAASRPRVDDGRA